MKSTFRIGNVTFLIRSLIFFFFFFCMENKGIESNLFFCLFVCLLLFLFCFVLFWFFCFFFFFLYRGTYTGGNLTGGGGEG